jgi:cation transport regulator ChaB
MPYDRIEELPESIKNLPKKAQVMFLQAFNKVYDKYGEETSFKIAWNVVKKNFKRVDGKWIAKGMGVKLYSFDLKINNSFVQKGDDGEYYLEGILSDTFVDREGNQFTEEALKDFANQINTHGISGFITHEDWNKFCVENSHLDTDVFISKARNERKGILKVIKAVYEAGKLWIKAVIDKRYVKRVKEFSKMSLEAYVPEDKQSNNKYFGGEILGLALDNNAINPRAVIARVT